MSPAVARRFLVLHHFLAPPRSLPEGRDGILAVFDRLGSLQFDPIEIAGRNHDLVLLARVPGYRRQMTDRLLYEERALFETYNKGLSLVPTADLPWYRVAWDRTRIRHDEEAFVTHADLVDELLTRIRETGPMSSIDVEPRAAIDWYWRPTNQIRAILEALAESGILGLSRRELLAGLIDDGTLLPVAIEGIRGVRYVPAEELMRLDQAEREVAAGSPPGGAVPAVAFLAALDPLAWDRDFLRSLFDFDYLWEVYVPAAKRRWGYYVLPILYGDRLVGRIEPRIERKSDTLRIGGLWWEDGFDPLAEPGFVTAFAAAIEAHRAFGGVRKVSWPRTAAHRSLVKAVRASGG